jgi:uncharacterized protein (DUF302 family)
VAIAALVFLIVVLWRLNGVLVDVKDTTVVVRKRAHDFDQLIGQTENTIKDFVSSFKSFLGAFEQLKNIKNRMTSFLEPGVKKTENTEAADKTENVKKAIDEAIKT